VRPRTRRGLAGALLAAAVLPAAAAGRPAESSPVEEDDPQLVIDVIVDAVREAR
jgi:hypothetical protein